MDDKPKTKPKWKSVHGKRRGGKKAKQMKECNNPMGFVPRAYKPFEIDYGRYH